MKVFHHKLIRRLLPILLVFAVSLWLFRSIDLNRFLKALETANWGLIGLAGILNLSLNTFARTMRFSSLIAPLPTARGAPGYWELTSLLLATRTLNTLLPAKAGEALRTVQLHVRFGYSVESILAVFLLEPLIEALSLGIPAWIFVAFFPTPPVLAIQFYIIGFIGIGGALLISLISMPRLEKVFRPDSWFGRRYSKWRESVQLLNSPRIWARGLIWSWVSDFVDLCTIGLCLCAVQVNLNPLLWFVVLVAVNLAIMLPLTPGAVGLLEAGAVLALSALGVDQNKALVFALFYHAIHVIPICIPGLISLHFWVRKIGISNRS